MKSFDQWDREQANAVALLPRCCECDEAIQDEYCFEINGELVCPACMEENHKKNTTGFIIWKGDKNESII